MVETGFKILGDIEHIQTRPGMYIGNTFSPNHLCQEVLDNALDELVNNFADTITIDNPSTGHIIITDNGRGIPIQNIKLEDKEIDSVIAACIKLFSGAKFDQDTYGFAIGLHGVGLTAVNALSKSVSITIRDKQKRDTFHHYEFINSEFIKKEMFLNKDVKWSTRVEFFVDDKYFTVSNFNMEQIWNRMCLVAAKTGKRNIIINGVKIPDGSFEQFARSQLNLEEEIPIFKVIGKNIEVYFTYDLTSSTQSIIKGDINLHQCGGTYHSNWTRVFSDCVIEKFKNNITKYEVLSNLRTYITMYVNDPQYDSQSKMNMTKNVSQVMGTLIPGINSAISSGYLNECITNIIERRSFKKASRIIKKKKKRISADNGFKDCLNTPGDILYIMEGKSADGSLAQIRNKRTEAILPISGKILNVVKSNIEKAVNSKKFKFLLEVLGVELNKKKQNYRYNEIKILADADPDGLHISVLIVLSLWYYAPQLIFEGRTKIILPPLYGAVKGNSFIPIYNNNDIQQYSNGYQIIRFKGIGEMSPSQLEVIIRHNKKEYIVLPPKDQAENDNIIRCITDVELKRKITENNQFNLAQLFKYVDV